MQVISISNGSTSRKANGRYVWQTIITYDNDEKERKSITAKTQTELKKKIKDFKKDILTEHNSVEGTYNHSFVYYLLNDWMQEKKIVEKLERHTLLTHEQRIRHDLQPFFGNKKPQDIKAQDIIQLYADMTNRGLQAETIHRVHAIINNAFKKLMRDERVFKNPCQFIKLPKIVVEEKKPLTKEEISTLLQTAKEYM